VKVVVILDGKVILEGNASDDGHRDADELWEALKSVKLKPTAAFAKLQIKDDAKQVTVTNTAPKGEESNLQIKMAYGGRAATREIGVTRQPADPAGREWQIDSKDIDRLFEYREISRYEASILKHPKIGD
jgi:hypothetical protein